MKLSLNIAHTLGKIILVCTTANLSSVVFAQNDLKLSNDCPRYFIKTSKGLCQLDIPYFHNKQQAVYAPRLENIDLQLDPRQIDLGRYLFFDKRLSGDQKMSCSSCHMPHLAMADGQAQSLGKNGVKLDKSAPALWNLAFKKRFLWDGSISKLHEQNAKVLEDPLEMNNNPANVLATINSIAAYKKAFSEIFPKNSPSWEQVLSSLSSFQLTLLSFGSRFDAFVFGDSHALSQSEINGFNVFRSFLSRCSECHTPPLFSHDQIVQTGVVGSSRSKEGFVVPSLRNIAQTAPYMHQGQFRTLAEVVRFYNLGKGREQKPVHWHIHPLGLTTKEERDLVAFLHSLTDLQNLPQIPELPH